MFLSSFLMKFGQLVHTQCSFLYQMPQFKWICILEVIKNRINRIDNITENNVIFLVVSASQHPNLTKKFNGKW